MIILLQKGKGMNIGFMMKNMMFMFKYRIANANIKLWTWTWNWNLRMWFSGVPELELEHFSQLCSSSITSNAGCENKFFHVFVLEKFPKKLKKKEVQVQVFPFAKPVECVGVHPRWNFSWNLRRMAGEKGVSAAIIQDLPNCRGVWKVCHFFGRKGVAAAINVYDAQ